MVKSEIVRILRHDPKACSSQMIDDLVGATTDDDVISATELRDLFLNIYNLNEYTPLGEADKGLLGVFNRQSNKRRDKRTTRKLRSGGKLTRIYAEGDSWFQHPLIPEIVDHLGRMLEKREYVVLNSAMGGDWLLNYVYGEEYIEEITLYKPHIVLLSGGGNDIVGNKKIAILVDTEGAIRRDLETAVKSGVTRKEALSSIRIVNRLIDVDSIDSEDTIDRLYDGFRFLTDKAFSIVWFLELCYKYLLKNIKRRVPEAKFITHGYDYVIPSARRASRLLQPRRALGNRRMDNGHWLLDALLLRGVVDAKAQRNIMFTIIYCFNEMLIRLGRNAQFGANVYHVDARGTAKSDNDWFDEMHLSPRSFKKVAAKFLVCIESTNPTDKVF